MFKVPFYYYIKYNIIHNYVLPNYHLLPMCLLHRAYTNHLPLRAYTITNYTNYLPPRVYTMTTYTNYTITAYLCLHTNYLPFCAYMITNYTNYTVTTYLFVPKL